MPRGRLTGFAFLAVSLVLAGLILTDAWPYLRGPAPGTSEWYWPFLLRPLGRWWPALAVGGVLAGVGAWWLRRAPGHDRLPLALLMVLNLALQLALVYADRPNVGAELVDRTLSKASNGYLATAGEIVDLQDALRRYPSLMMTFDNEHARTHPPGLVALPWLTEHALGAVPGLATSLARPATFWRCTDLWVLSRPPSTAASLLIWSWLPPIMAALAVLPAYFLSARRSGQARAVRLASLLVAVLPALLVFVPTPDQMFAALAILSLWMFDIGVRERRWTLMLAVGLLVSFMSFLSLGNAAWGALLGVYGALWLWPEASHGLTADATRCRMPIWALLVVFIVGAAAFWLAYWAGWGVPPWEIARAGLDQHYELVTRLRRYDWWLGYNAVDFLLFAGPVVVFGLVSGAFVWARGRTGRSAADGAFSLLLVLLLLGINVAGSTRGEVGRLWLVFMPAAAVVAGGFFGRRIGDRAGLWMLFLAQLVLALSIGLGWRTFYAVILPVEPPMMRDAAPSQALSTAFATPDGRTLIIDGYELSQTAAMPGNSLDVMLFWRSDGPTLRPYTVFLQLLDQSGRLVAQQDRWPVENTWPPTCWSSGEQVVDPYLLPLPEDLPAGRYLLVVGLYDTATGERLQTGSGDSVRLSEITIEP